MPPEIVDPGPRAGAAALVGTLHDAVAAGDEASGAGFRVAEQVRRRHPLASPEEVRAVVGQVLDRVDGLGPLQVLLDDPEVSEVMVNGPHRPVWVERRGRLQRTGIVLDERGVDLAVERIASPLGVRVDRTRPAVDARLGDGSRVNIVVPPLAVDGPCITIRRFVVRSVALADLCPPGVGDLLARAVAERRNLVAVGGAGAGKTTLVNALAAEIDPHERIVTVEDAAELELAHPHVVRLETRGSASIRDLVRNALRMRPDRIIVGEVRGAEALDLVVAMNTGHEGALSTLHANSAADALARLETMVLLAGSGLPLAAIRSQVAASLDLIVEMARLGDGRRRVVEVVEVSPEARAGGRRCAVRRLAGPAGIEAQPSRPPRARPAS
jgi:pilus assembly protein CpaF